MYGALSAIFLCVNVVCAALGDRGVGGGSREWTWKLVLIRVLVNDSLFILEAVFLATVLLLLTKHSRSASPYLISKVGKVIMLKATQDKGVLSPFYTSRLVYS